MDAVQALPRISGRLGNPIDLNITFYRNGIPTDPYAIRKVVIYHTSIQCENIVSEIIVVPPDDPTYPSPLSREVLPGPGRGECCTVGTEIIGVKPGIFHLILDVPQCGIQAPGLFFDVWHYYPLPCNIGSNCPEACAQPSPPANCPEASTPSITGECIPEQTQTVCERFWLYPDSFFADSGLETIRIGFEAIDAKFQQPEVRTLEVGMMPLPLYDYSYNLIAPIIPNLKAYFTLMTDSGEVLIFNEPMRIGIRQGTFRSNPFVLQYTFDTMRVLRGSFRYQVSIALPNGETRVSQRFALQVS